MSEIGSAEWWRVQYAALEKERDEAWAERAKMCAEKHSALADNAALLDRIGDGAAIACEEAGPEDCGKCGTCLDRSIMRQPHPGAALLEEHRKALESAHSDGRRHALLQMLDRLGMDSACMYGDPEATDTRLSDELWGHVRWLEVRARNEGLEKAASGCDAKAAMGQGWEAWAEAARFIRAMKEPESEG